MSKGILHSYINQFLFVQILSPPNNQNKMESRKSFLEKNIVAFTYRSDENILQHFIKSLKCDDIDIIFIVFMVLEELSCFISNS